MPGLRGVRYGGHVTHRLMLVYGYRFPPGKKAPLFMPPTFPPLGWNNTVI